MLGVGDVINGIDGYYNGDTYEIGFARGSCTYSRSITYTSSMYKLVLDHFIMPHSNC